jgi:peptide deformylase
MAILDVITYPDKFLRTSTRRVVVVDDTVRRLIDDMAETMYSAPGIGLAATQVGSDLRLLIYDISPPEEDRELRVLINPEIIDQEGSQLSENEGCLSVPDYRADVKRYARVIVKAQDRDGNPITIEDDGFHAIVLQHEIDHLDGILFIDRISPLKREMYKRRVRKQLKNS